MRLIFQVNQLNDMYRPYVGKHMAMETCMYAFIHRPYINAYVQNSWMHVYVNACVRASMCSCMHTYVYLFVHIYPSIDACKHAKTDT